MPLPPATRTEAAGDDDGHQAAAIAAALAQGPANGRAPETGAADTGPFRDRGYGGPSATAAYAGLGGPYGAQASGPAGANHTMIVPTGVDDDFAGGGYPARPSRRRSRGYRDPFLQRWLFSRRILIVLGALVVAGIIWWIADGQYVAVPNVARMTASGARADLSNAGLVAASGPARHSDSVPAGDVIRTEPDGRGADHPWRHRDADLVARPGHGQDAVGYRPDGRLRLTWR